MRNSGSSPGLLEQDSFKDKKIIVYNYFPWFTCSVLLFCVVFEYFANQSLPSTLGRGPSSPEKFSVDNAKAHLKGLTDLGPRITGSQVTEVKTPAFLLGVLEKIKASAPDNVIIELDEQHPTSNFYIDFLGGINNVYDGVTNVVAKVSWKDSPIHPEATEAILINAHFDSVPGSPGGSDDGVGVACMLEAMRALVQGPNLRRPVIFLFNGAEESNHQAAHGFISLHKWAPQVKFLINLEAIGAGGHEMVFQCNSGWLARHYAKVAPYPHSQVVAHELFKNFLYRVASTDWSTIIKYGKPGMVGIDTAYIENGFVYHTSFDTIDKIPDGTYLNTGENILEMSRSLSTALEIPDFQLNSKTKPVEDNTIDTSVKILSRYEDEHAVFVDFLGLNLFVYSGVYVKAYHTVSVLFGLFAVYILSHYSKNLTFFTVCSLLFDEFIGIWLPSLLTGLVGVFFYFVCPMRWYAGGVTIAVVMYCPIAMFNTMLVRAFLTTRSHNSAVNRQIAAILMNAMIAVPFILLDVMSAYVWCLWVVFVSAASLVQLSVKQYYSNNYPAPDPSPKAGLSSYPHAIKTFGSFASTSNLARSQSSGNMKRTLSTGSVKDIDCQTTTVAMINHHAGRYLYSPEFYYVIVISPMILLWVQTIHLTFIMLIPLLGKSGTTTPGDPLLGFLFGLLIALPSGCVLINDIQRPLQRSSVQSCLSALLVGFIVVNIAFRSSYSDLRPKRLWIQHVERHTIVRDSSDALFSPPTIKADQSLVDYGLWVNAFDSNGMAPIKGLPALDVESKDTQCSNANGDCYFDFPWYFPVAEALKDSVYLPTTDRPQIPDHQRLQMTVNAQILSNEVCHRYKCERRIQSLVDENEFMFRAISIAIKGPSHMNLVIRDRARGKRIPYWKINGGNNLENMVTPPEIRADGIHYFSLGFGLCAEELCSMTLTLIVKGADKVDIAGYGQYVDIIDNKEVRSFINDLPSWSKGAEWTNFPSIIIRDSV